MNSTQEANAPRNYIFLTLAIIVGFVGIYFRFAGDTHIFSWISNAIFVFAVILALAGVFRILK